MVAASNGTGQRFVMYPEIEQRRGGFGGLIFAIVAIALIGYLAFAALQGEYGLFRLFQVEAQETRLEQELGTLRAERTALADKTERLSGGHVDPDLLEEQARRILGLGRADEIIIR